MKLLGFFWFVPFGFYDAPLRSSKVMPHPLAPRNHRDLILNKMMFPDNASRAVIADKIAVRGWITERVGGKYLTPLIDICKTTDDLRLEEYPLPYIVKSNHASGQNIFVRERGGEDKTRKQTRKWLQHEYNRDLEWCYNDIDRSLLVEELLLDDAGETRPDIRFHFFFGELVLVSSDQEELGGRNLGYFDKDWEWLKVYACEGIPAVKPEKPKHYDEMVKIGQKLATEFDLIRIDFIDHPDQVYIGEMTNFHMAGTAMFKPPEFNGFLLDEYKRLRKKHIAEQRTKYTEMAKAALSD